MEILYLSLNFPFPATTGTSLIAYHHIRELANVHRLDLLSLNASPVSDFGGLDQICRDITIVPLHPTNRLLHVLKGAVDWRPWQVLYFESRAMHKAVNSALHRKRYDAIIFQHTPMAQYRPHAYDGASIWSIEDPPILKNLRLLQSQNWRERLRTHERVARLRAYERRNAIKFDRIVVLNSADARDYSMVLPEANIAWVPYGVDTQLLIPGAFERREPEAIVISGNMDHKPNVDAVHFFVERVFPLVLARVPTAKLWIVGANPTVGIQNLASGAITVTGRVNDVGEYLGRARVAVCAVQLPIGTQTKVLEALACGTPVVTTTAGNRGVLGTEAHGVFTSDEPERLATAVVTVLTTAKWRELSHAARSFVLREFSWKSSGERLDNLVREAVIEARHRQAEGAAALEHEPVR